MSPSKIVRTPKARRDIIEIATTLGRTSPATEDRFLDALEATLSRLARNPEIGPIVDFASHEPTDLRYALVQRFRNYVIFYRASPNGIEVYRVVHGSRDLDAILGEVEDQDHP